MCIFLFGGVGCACIIDDFIISPAPFWREGESICIQKHRRVSLLGLLFGWGQSALKSFKQAQLKSGL